MRSFSQFFGVFESKMWIRGKKFSTFHKCEFIKPQILFILKNSFSHVIHELFLISCIHQSNPSNTMNDVLLYDEQYPVWKTLCCLDGCSPILILAIIMKKKKKNPLGSSIVCQLWFKMKTHNEKIHKPTCLHDKNLNKTQQNSN